MIRLRVSKRLLRILAWIVLVPLLFVGLYGVGAAVTPRDGSGRPLLLSPSLRAAEQYRARASAWVAEMVEIEQRLTALLVEEATSDPGALYVQGQEMQRVGEQAASLVQEVSVAEVPVALAGLRDQVEVAANAHLEAALATARWFGAPSEAGRQEALETLHTARALRAEVEESRWLRVN